MTGLRREGLGQLQEHEVRFVLVGGVTIPMGADDGDDGIDLVQRAEDHGPEIGARLDRIDVAEHPLIAECFAQTIVKSADEMTIIGAAIRHEDSDRTGPVVSLVTHRRRRTGHPMIVAPPVKHERRNPQTGETTGVASTIGPSTASTTAVRPSTDDV